MTSLEPVPSSQEKSHLIRCDFQFSKKCKREYRKIYRNVLKCRENNAGKDRCQYCFNSLTKNDSQNYNFQFSKNECYFELIDSEIKAYLLGWVAGDGSLKKDGLYLSVHFLDREILDLFTSEICPTIPITYRNYDHTANLKIHSVKLVSDLCRHLNVDVGKKSHVISIPNLNSDRLIWAFVRGWFDADGSIHSIDSKSTAPACNLCSMSILIRNQITNLSKNNNINCSISKFSVVWKGTNAIKFLGKLYDTASVSLTRKRCLYKMWKTWKPFKGTIFRSKKEIK